MEEYLKSLSEKAILSMIFDYYAAKRYWIRRNNTGAHQLHNSEGKSRIVRYGVKGSGDLLMAIPIFGLPLIGYIECKRYGKKQTPAQEDFQIDCERNNIFYVVASSVEDVEKARIAYVEKMTQKVLANLSTVQAPQAL